MTPIQASFAPFREPVDRKVFAPGFRLWLILSRLCRALIMLPDRGPDASPHDLPPEYFRFPRF